MLKYVFNWSMLLIAQCFALILYSSFFHGLFFPAFHLPPDFDCFRYNAGALTGHPVTVGSAGLANPWMYPPPFLLLAAPLSWLSPGAAFAIWSVAGICMLIAAGRIIGMSWLIVWLALLSPAALNSLAAGQTGLIVSAFLLVSFGTASTWPVLAGICAGCLVIKPQFALLLPICFLASRNWRAFFAAGVTAFCLCSLTVVLFGLKVWQHFLQIDIGTARAVLDRPWPQPFQHIMVSPFMLLRGAGASVSAASLVQIASTCVAAGAAWWLWSRHRPSTMPRLLLTLCLVPLVTPYAYIYDIVGIAMALAGYTAAGSWQNLLPLSAFWLITSGYVLLALLGCPPLGALGFLILFLVILCEHELGQSPQQTGAIVVPQSVAG